MLFVVRIFNSVKRILARTRVVLEDYNMSCDEVRSFDIKGFSEQLLYER